MSIKSKKRLPSPPHNPGLHALVDGKRDAALPLASDIVELGFKGWHERGYLPHRDEPGLVQFVTFRLTDTFPLSLRGEWEHLLKIEDDRKRRTQLESYLDKGRGNCELRNPEIAKVIQESLLFGHGVEYDLRAWVVMPNHVHLLFQTQHVPMWKLIDAWKGYTAKVINKILRRKGQFWQDGYWDTYMRSGDHERRARRYIENNPVKARLTESPQSWTWSSARFCNEYGMLQLPTGARRLGRRIVRINEALVLVENVGTDNAEFVPITDAFRVVRKRRNEVRFCARGRARSESFPRRAPVSGAETSE